MAFPNPKSLLDTAVNAAKKKTGDGGGAGSVDAADLFSSKSSDFKQIGNFAVSGPFMDFAALDAKDAWEYYPYEFTIFSLDSNPSLASKAPDKNSALGFLTQASNLINKTTQKNADQAGSGKVLKSLVLPLAPQSITINTPTAIVTTVTMNGLTEEHNGAPLRTISISGTMGIAPVRRLNPSPIPSTGNVLKDLFNNTIKAPLLAYAENKVKRLGDSFKDFSSPLIDQGVLNGTGEGELNGYAMMHNLARFFDIYLAAKQKGAKNMYLGFNMHKDKMYYDCTLNGYTINKTAGSMEMTYTIQLTAWRRRAQPAGTIRKTFVPATKGAGTLLDEINKNLAKGIKVMNTANSIFRSFSSDFDTAVMGPARKLTLFLDATNGAVTSMVSLPDSIKSSLKNASREVYWSLYNFGGGAAGQDDADRISKYLKEKGLSPATPESTALVGDTVLGEDASRLESAGVSVESQSNSQEAANPMDTIFNNPSDYYDFFEILDLNNLNVPPSVQDQIDAAIDDALQITAADVRETRANLDAFVSQYSAYLGGSNDTYNRINGISGQSSGKKLSTEDIEVLSIFNDMSQAMDSLSVLLENQERSISPDNDYSAFYAEYATTAGIDFQPSTSKFYVPFQYGATLETMAQLYLDNSDRWIEIAAINGLKEPYVDEVGKTVYFVGSGSGTSFTIPFTSNLYIGQPIKLSSDTVREEIRKIIKVDAISAVEQIITVDGASNLSRFKIVDKPKLLYFQPNTVNSNMLIAIPSNNPVNIPGSIQTNPNEEDLTIFNMTAKTDFMLLFNKGTTADIALDASDVKLASGMSNLVQAANIKLLTKTGDLMNDPTFGNPIEVGGSVAEFDIKEAMASLSNTFASDPRFKNVLSGKISLTGPTVTTDLLIGLENSNAFLPLTTQIPRV
jgi:hypothetical protein